MIPDTDTRPDLDIALASPSFPGGSLFNAVYDRTLMRFSDRGGASGIIGDRWADLCALALGQKVETLVTLDQDVPPIACDGVVRLDDIPEVARVASRAHLQNPDFLLVGTQGGRQTIKAADAKFSVETAKSRQVSAHVVKALLDLGQTVRDRIPDLHDDVALSDGIFLCPDYSLTRHVLRGGQGLRRIAVPDREVCLLEVQIDEFMRPIGHERLIQILAARDDLGFDYRQSLLLTLYYFRLARSAVGFRVDQTTPLLASRDAPEVDLADVEAEAERIGKQAFGAWNLILRWNDIAEEVRRQRLAVDAATGYPIPGRILRQQVEQRSVAAGVEPPSTNRVRRIAGSWMRARIRQEFGPIDPPVDDLDKLLRELRAFARSLTPAVAAYTDDVIGDLIAEQPPIASPDGAARSA
ncbi:MAG TPA: hypothetical protein VGR08_09440 [Thermomicrobiales bacterium]|nr:hypothetical protein [Thermomicrobiales bacterium]